jgi:hypothetical protein
LKGNTKKSARPSEAAQPPRVEQHLNDLEKELVEMEVENFATSCSLELHKKQFGLLLHVVSAISFRGMFVTAKFPTF